MKSIQADKTFTINGKKWIAKPNQPFHSHGTTVYGIYCGRNRWGLAQQLEDLPSHKVWAVLYWPDNNITPVVLNATANSLKRAVEILHERIYRRETT